MNMSKNQQESLANFIQITQADLGTAKHIMEASDWDVDKAVSLFFETGGAGFGGSSAGAPQSPVYIPPEEPEVRAPIPQRVQRLVDSFSPVSPTPRTVPAGFNQELPAHVREMFNNVNQQFNQQFNNNRFQAQWEDFESNMQGSGVSTAPSVVQRNSNVDQFDKLFSPPKSILFTGSFQAAKDNAANTGKWLLVDIHNKKEFNSLRLNRDTWSDDILQSIISVYFTFWQVENTTQEGKRFMQMYQANSSPYIAIVDPRTGELKKTFDKFMDAQTMTEVLQKWVEKNPLDIPSPQMPSSSSKSVSFQEPPQASVPAASSGSGSISFEDYDMGESVPPEFIPTNTSMEEDDAELRLAIQASLEAATQPGAESAPAASTSAPAAQAPVQEEPVVTAPARTADMDIDPKQYITEAAQDSTRVQFRMPGKPPQVVKLLLSSPLAALYAIVRQQLPEQDRTKRFTLIFMGKELENTVSVTIKEQNIVNASLSVKFDE